MVPCFSCGVDWEGERFMSITRASWVCTYAAYMANCGSVDPMLTICVGWVALGPTKAAAATCP